jgi:hypothetical protein
MTKRVFFAHSMPGILGVFPSDQEIVAVFPELSSTIIPHAQEIRIRRGDAIDIAVQLQNDDDPPDPFLLRDGVLRWAAKIGFGKTERAGVELGDEAALILKRSYDKAEIEFVKADQALIHIDREDSLKLPLTPALWDLEATVPTDAVAVPPNAMAMLLANSDIVLAAVGTNWETLGAKPGFLLTIQDRTVIVRERISPAHLRVDFAAWTTSPSEAFKLSRATTRTVASGPFVIEGDVVR